MTTLEAKHRVSQTWKRLLNAVRMLIRSEHGTKAIGLAVTLIVMMLVINALNVANSYVCRFFMSAIEHKDMGNFQKFALIYGGVFIASSVAAAFFRFSEERLGVLWREQLTWRLTDAYLDQRTYYRLDSSTGVANPDQRITEDVRAFTTTTLSFILLFINGTVTAISFSGVLWSISPMLFGVAVLYAIIGSALTVFLGKPLIRLNYNQLDMEANFRANLIHVRENSESIALAHREGRFKARLKKRLDDLTGNLRHIFVVNRNLGFFTNSYNYFIQIIPALLIAPMFIHGKIDFGVITQSAMAFATLLGAFSLIVTQFQSISTFTAVTSRLELLSDAIEQTHHTETCPISMESRPDVVRYENLSLATANADSSLLVNLNLEIPRGSRWVVTSQSDASKVALFLSTAGVWEGNGSGKIQRPDLDDVLFLPERPYLPPGTLREVLLRTGAELTTQDSEIQKVLESLDLQEIVSRAGGLDADKDWDDIFSIGEQHMLSIARIFLAHPLFVFLDRPGSALTKSKIAEILDMLSQKNIGVVVLAKNGESRLQYDSNLEIHADGTWNIHRETVSVPGKKEATLALDDFSC